MNLNPLIRQLSIVDKKAAQIPLRPNWAQQQYIDTVHASLEANKPIRIIVLKARQIGISTISQAVIFTLAFVFERVRGLVVANEVDNAQHLLGMTNTYWESYPFRRLYTQKYGSRNELAWVETGSSLRVATARNTKAGRAKTIHCLHASEVAFWEEADTTMLGLRQAVPELPATLICLESTANGVGNWFYATWQAAEQGDVDYVPLFFPWYQHPEYTASAINIPYYDLRNLDSEERALRAIGISDDRLAWRRWAIRNLANNDVTQFHQEYPTTPEEAFVATGTNVFPVGKLRDIYQPLTGRPGRLTRDGDSVRFQADIAGPLRVFKWPSRDTDHGVYMVAGDPTHTTRGDYACAQVINRRTHEQVAVYRGRIDPGSFGEELAKIGAYYNDAVLVPEVEGPGYATVSRLITIGYPHVWFNRLADRTPGKISDHYGWRTTARSKDLAIGWLLKYVVDKDILIHDARTFQEMRDYVTLPSGGYGPASEKGYDDTVMALAIGITAHALEPPLMAYAGVGPGGGEEQVPTWEAWGDG